MKKLLTTLEEIGKKAQSRISLGIITAQPHGDNPNKMSHLSGPSPLVDPVKEIRRDPRTGVPQLPAENATYLGRSLFTDYLLPVELGGFLLLVAVIGAVAIAQRVGKPGRTA